MPRDTEFADLAYTWLKRLLPLRRKGITLRGMPNKPKEYGEAQDSGQIALLFQGRDYLTDFTAEDSIQSTEVTNYKLDIRLKTMRDKVENGADVDGADYILKEILNLILGTQIVGYQPTKVSSLRFAGESEDFWVYELTFNLQRMISIPLTLIDLSHFDDIALEGAEFDKPLPLAEDGSLTIVTGLFVSEAGKVGQIPPSVKIDEVIVKFNPEDDQPPPA